MSQVRRAEGQIELKTDADKFFDIWVRKTNLVSELCPHIVPQVELQQGDSWNSLGAVTFWNFVESGRPDSVKTKVAEIDEKKRYVRYDYLKGHGLLKSSYKSLKSKMEAIPKAEGEGCIVKWTFEEYEKMTEDAPDGSLYIDLLLQIAITLDARLSHAS